MDAHNIIELNQSKPATGRNGGEFFELKWGSLQQLRCINFSANKRLCLY